MRIDQLLWKIGDKMSEADDLAVLRHAADWCSCQSEEHMYGYGPLN